MAFKQILVYDTLRSIDSSTFSGSYQALGTPLANGATIVKIVNNSTVLVTVSVDAVHDHDVVPGGSFFLYDVTTNKASSTPILVVGANTQYYIKGSAGTGLVYLVVQYIPQG